MRFTSKAAAFAVIGWAASGWGAEPVRLADLIAEALRNNPEVLAAQKNYEAARQRPSREGSLPNPTLSVGYASNGGPLPGQQLGSNPTSNIGFMVSQEIPYPAAACFIPFSASEIFSSLACACCSESLSLVPGKCCERLSEEERT